MVDLSDFKHLFVQCEFRGSRNIFILQNISLLSMSSDFSGEVDSILLCFLVFQVQLQASWKQPGVLCKCSCYLSNTQGVDVVLGSRVPFSAGGLDG